MLKPIHLQKDYTKNSDGYQLKLPLNIETIIPENDSVRLLSQFVEAMDLTDLYSTYERINSVSPRTLLKIVLYSYMNGDYSSRSMELNCKRDINFMWLLAGSKAPDHSTIARFRSSFLEEACEDLFYQMVSRLEKAGELSKETVFIDGTKIESFANRYTFVWKKSVTKWEEKMFQKIQDAVAEINSEYIKSFCVNQETRTQDLKKICRFLENICTERNVCFVHGRGKRKSRSQKYLELFQNFLNRQMIYDWHSASFKGRNSYSKTDPDATFMHMKDDHMKNAQLKPGYNVQIAADSEYIVGADIFQDRNDVWTLVPFTDYLEEKLGFRYPSITADAGYESEEGYSHLEAKKIRAYIKPQTYEQYKKRSFKNDISKRENMTYDPEIDSYLCHNKKKLIKQGTKHSRSKNGFESEITIYECESCEGCPCKEKCTKARGNKKLYVSKKFIEQRQRSYENITSEKGILYRTNRSIQVEGAFGVLKNDYEFQRFLLRGKTKVKLEILLLCLGYNINKLHTKIQGNRLGHHFHPLKTA